MGELVGEAVLSLLEARFIPQMPAIAAAQLGQRQNQKLLFHRGYRYLRTWISFCSLPRHIHKELQQKQRSWILMRVGV